MYFQIGQCVQFDKNRVNRSHKHMQLQLLLQRCSRNSLSATPSRKKRMQFPFIYMYMWIDNFWSLKTAFALFIRLVLANHYLTKMCNINKIAKDLLHFPINLKCMYMQDLHVQRHGIHPRTRTVSKYFVAYSQRYTSVFNKSLCSMMSQL